VSITINSNLAASQSSLSLKRASDRLSKSIQRLSSGNRIVSPSEDAGGLAVAMKLESSLRRASATMMNTQNGVSFLQMQDGALKVVGEIVDRMSELKSFYNDVSKNDEDRENYNFEFRELQKELASLKSQKFNGVSLFATDSAFAGGINIMTSDDGLGDPIELSRLGLFENLKSKYGADGKLNSGANGSYRQLVGDYEREGGYSGFDDRATRDYSEGDVVYLQSEDPENSGYFMALGEIASGAMIEDTGNFHSNWIRIADNSGNGFSEAYPDAQSYDMRNLQFNAKGEAMSYLKGDIIKVQAHWNDPNSFVFLKAQNDVPQNIMIDQLLLNGIGTGKYFDFIGKDQAKSKKSKPTTQFGLPNKAHSTPLEMKNADAESLRSVMDDPASNNYTPTFIQLGGEEGDIYRPLKSDWGFKRWIEGNTYEPGDLIYYSDADPSSASFIREISDKVKGTFVSGADYEQGDIVIKDGNWFMAESAGHAEAFGENIFMRSDDVVEGYAVGDSLLNDQVVKDSDGNWYELQQTAIPDVLNKIIGSSDDPLTVDIVDAELSNKILNNTLGDDDLVVINGVISKLTIINPPVDDGSGTLTIGAEDYSFANATLQEAIDAVITTDVTSLIDLNEEPDLDNNDFWEPWKATADDTSVLDDPNFSGFAVNKTSDYQDPSNKDIWTKTYFSELNGISVNMDYERGDNIFYQGKHYVYVSDTTSSHPSFGGDEGVNDFQQLLLGGAIKEVGVYVDTLGAGGSSTKAKDSFYAANQDLEFVDRLADSGQVLTSGVQRRGDPMQNGDGIFNTLDDQLYNSLNAGNDGIFGTMDDFYSTTPYGDVASSAAHADADADNNRDLLDTANDLGDFSVADFVDYIQTVANFRAVNGGTMSRLNYANRILEENRINLESAHGRIMNADIALESSKLARQNVLIQASAAMITQANQMNQIVLQLLQ
jgi:flagellin-like hook-associated protein FlgL